MCSFFSFAIVAVISSFVCLIICSNRKADGKYCGPIRLMLQLSGKAGKKMQSNAKRRDESNNKTVNYRRLLSKTMILYSGFEYTFRLVCKNAAHISSEHNVFRFPFISSDKYIGCLLRFCLLIDPFMYHPTVCIYVVCQFEKSSFVCAICDARFALFVAHT